MSLYTRKGDEGTTSLFDGEKVGKDHIRIQSLSWLDLLDSWVGMMSSNLNCEEKKFLLFIQEILYKIKCHVGNPSREKLPEIHDEYIVALENEINQYQLQLNELKHFIIPNGCLNSCNAHIARCYCRLTETHLASLIKNEFLSPNVFKFINRLSDYFFILARFLNKKENVTEEIISFL
jgi:cob(I)alamin adenosyltransferase